MKRGKEAIYFLLFFSASTSVTLRAVKVMRRVSSRRSSYTERKWHALGGSDWRSFSALSASVKQKVYK